MVAGRFKWKDAGAGIPGKLGLAAFDFTDAGTLILTEASSKKRASIHLVDDKLGSPRSTPAEWKSSARR